MFLFFFSIILLFSWHFILLFPFFFDSLLFHSYFKLGITTIYPLEIILFSLVIPFLSSSFSYCGLCWIALSTFWFIYFECRLSVPVAFNLTLKASCVCTGARLCAFDWFQPLTDIVGASLTIMIEMCVLVLFSLV